MNERTFGFKQHPNILISTFRIVRAFLRTIFRVNLQNAIPFYHAKAILLREWKIFLFSCCGMASSGYNIQIDDFVWRYFTQQIIRKQNIKELEENMVMNIFGLYVINKKHLFQKE